MFRTDIFYGYVEISLFSGVGFSFFDSKVEIFALLLHMCNLHVPNGESVVMWRVFFS